MTRRGRFPHAYVVSFFGGCIDALTDRGEETTVGGPVERPKRLPVGWHVLMGRHKEGWMFDGTRPREADVLETGRESNRQSGQLGTEQLQGIPLR